MEPDRRKAMKGGLKGEIKSIELEIGCVGERDVDNIIDGILNFS